MFLEVREVLAKPDLFRLELFGVETWNPTAGAGMNAETLNLLTHNPRH